MTDPLSPAPPLQDAELDAHLPRRDRPLQFLVRSAAALVSTTAVTSVLGFAYWALGARKFPSASLGAAATAVSAMTLIATLGTLGFGTLLMSKLPTMERRRADLVASTSLLSGLVAAVLAVMAALVLPTSVIGLPHAKGSVVTTSLFAAGVSLTAVTLVLDQGLLSLLGGGPQLGRNAVLSVAKLALLVLFALTLSNTGALSIFTSWMLGNAVSIVFMALWISLRYHVSLYRVRPGTTLLHGLHRDATAHHALNLGLQVPYFAMPVVASATLGSESAAHLYATWSVAGIAFGLPIALSTSLFALGARDSSGFTRQFRFSLRSSLLACTAAIVFLALLGGLVLRFFGNEYAAAGRSILLIICLGGIPLIIKDHHVSVARVVGRVGREAALMWGFALAELAGATIGARRAGLSGLAGGWLVVVLVQALIFLPLVVRAAKGHLPSAGG